jgi:hypothetical protein
MKVSKKTIQFAVVGVVCIAWLAALVVAFIDGTAGLKAVTPFVTLVFGWLFAERATAVD